VTSDKAGSNNTLYYIIIGAVVLIGLLFMFLYRQSPAKAPVMQTGSIQLMADIRELKMRGMDDTGIKNALVSKGYSPDQIDLILRRF
jgi:LPXTG-motif cell wall-anchored protein